MRHPAVLIRYFFFLSRTQIYKKVSKFNWHDFSVDICPPPILLMNVTKNVQKFYDVVSRNLVAQPNHQVLPTYFCWLQREWGNVHCCQVVLFIVTFLKMIRKLSYWQKLTTNMLMNFTDFWGGTSPIVSKSSSELVIQL